MNALDEELIQQLRAELDALTADVSATPPSLESSVGVARVVTMQPRSDRRRVLALAAAMVALIAAVTALVTVRHDGGSVGSTDSSPDSASVTTYPTSPLAAHPIPPTPEGWDLLEWGNVRLSLPPELSPFRPENGCVSEGDESELRIACGVQLVHIGEANLDSPPDQTINGFHAVLHTAECDRCQTLVIFELNAKISVRWDAADSPLKIIDTVGPSGQWRFGHELRPTPPAGWLSVKFGGVSIRYPPDWSVQSVAADEASPCPGALMPHTVLLDLGSPIDCEDPLLVPPTDGVHLYLGNPPLPLRLGWPQSVVASGTGGDTPMVVMRTGFGVDPSVGQSILSSFSGVSTDTSSTYETVPLTNLPYLAVGESVMLGAKSNLDGKGIRTITDVSQGPDWEIQQLHLARSDYNISHGVVIQLGLNGSVTREQYDAVLAEVSDLPRVVVMTVSGTHPWVVENNEIIRSLPLTHQNVVVLDWEERSAEVADHLASDGIHLRDDVAKAFYTNLILEALGLPTS